MAEAIAKVSTVFPLKGTNYSTWKVQCRMALMKEGLWNILTKKEVAPRDETSQEYTTFMNRYNLALATIILTVDPTLLYLLRPSYTRQLVASNQATCCRNRTAFYSWQHVAYKITATTNVASNKLPRV